MGVETLDAVADRGYYAGEEIRACEEAGITVTLPKPMTSNAKAAGRFGKQDFRYVAAEDAYVCPAGQRLRKFRPQQPYGSPGRLSIEAAMSEGQQRQNSDVRAMSA